MYISKAMAAPYVKVALPDRQWDSSGYAGRTRGACDRQLVLFWSPTQCRERSCTAVSSGLRASPIYGWLTQDMQPWCTFCCPLLQRQEPAGRHCLQMTKAKTSHPKCLKVGNWAEFSRPQQKCKREVFSALPDVEAPRCGNDGAQATSLCSLGSGGKRSLPSGCLFASEPLLHIQNINHQKEPEKRPRN